MLASRIFCLVPDKLNTTQAIHKDTKHEYKWLPHNISFQAFQWKNKLRFGAIVNLVDMTNSQILDTLKTIETSTLVLEQHSKQIEVVVILKMPTKDANNLDLLKDLRIALGSDLIHSSDDFFNKFSLPQFFEIISEGQLSLEVLKNFYIEWKKMEDLKKSANNTQKIACIPTTKNYIAPTSSNLKLLSAIVFLTFLPALALGYLFGSWLTKPTCIAVTTSLASQQTANQNKKQIEDQKLMLDSFKYRIKNSILIPKHPNATIDDVQLIENSDAAELAKLIKLKNDLSQITTQHSNKVISSRSKKEQCMHKIEAYLGGN